MEIAYTSVSRGIGIRCGGYPDTVVCRIEDRIEALEERVSIDEVQPFTTIRTELF